MLFSAEEVDYLLFSPSVVSNSATPWTAACQPSQSFTCLLEFAPTHVCWVSKSIQPSRLLSSPSPPAFYLSQHQGLFQWNCLLPMIYVDGQHRNQTDYILCSQRWRSSIQSAKTRPGADCGSDHELLIARFRLKLKKVGKTTRPFRYDLNQILFYYTMEVRNRFKGLNLIECLMNYRWRFVTLYRRQGARSSPRKRNAKKQNVCLRRPYQ